MKKIIAVILSITIIFTLVSCNKKEGPQGPKGDQGEPGKDGTTPTIAISDDGFWIINGEKTEYKAIGTDGEDGTDGQNGTKGEDGKTPTIAISDDGFWVINGEKTENKAIGTDGQNGGKGEDGKTPTIAISDDGFWIINGEKTANKAIGTDGQNGNKGEDGKTPTISISDDGFWIINGEKTANKAIGTDGQNGNKGEDGKTPTISISDDGFWIINGEKTEHKAIGKDGASALDNNPQCLAFYPKDDGSYAVACGEAMMLSNIVIPSTYNGKSVTEIVYGGREEEWMNAKEIIIPDSITRISDRAFMGADYITEIVLPRSITILDESCMGYNLEKIFYKGSEDEWNTIQVLDWYGQPSELDTEAIVYYYSENTPTDDGNYWHYVDDQIVIWDE